MWGLQDILRTHEYYASIKNRRTCHKTTWTCTADGPEQTDQEVRLKKTAMYNDCFVS